MPWSSSTQSIMDYTTVPEGLRIEGLIWTGQATTVTAICPKCGRIGVLSIIHDNKRIIVHSGRIIGDRLVGIDYCELVIPMPPAGAPISERLSDHIFNSESRT